MFGLAPDFAGRLDVTTPQVAKHVGITAASLTTLPGKQRESWAKHALADELVHHALEVLREQGGVASLERAAQALLARAEAARQLALVSRAARSSRCKCTAVTSTRMRSPSRAFA